MLDDQDIYDGVGGDAPFYTLVNRFYESVEQVPALRSLYPADLEPGKQRLAWFLIQRFGGPDYFNARRGAPMLRRRHMPFPIDRAVRDQWFKAMMDAVDAVPDFAPYREALEKYFAEASTFLINRSEPKDGQVMLRQV